MAFSSAEADSGIPKVAIVFPFFETYRVPVLRALAASNRYHFHFIAGRRDVTGRVPAASLLELSAIHPLNAPMVRIYRDLMWQRRLLALLRSGKYDAVVLRGNAYWPSTWLAALMASRQGAQILFWTHGWLRSETGPKLRVRRAFYRLADCLLVHHERAKTLALTYGFQEHRVIPIYNSLDFELHCDLMAELDGLSRKELLLQAECHTDSAALGPESILMVCVARLEPEKRLDLLLEAASTLHGQGGDVAVILVGDGPEMASLRAQARALGVRCVFMGACYEEGTVARVLAACDLMVVPDKAGLTVIHGLTFGLPVITHGDPDHQMPEYEAISPGFTGDYFERGSAADLAEVLSRWTSRMTSRDKFAHPGSPHLRGSVRSACYKSVEKRYQPKLQAQLIENGIERALRARGEEFSP